MIIILLIAILWVLIVGGKRFIRSLAIIAFIIMAIGASHTMHDNWVKYQDTSPPPATPEDFAKLHAFQAKQQQDAIANRLKQGKLP